MKLLLIRHGQTDFNIHGILQCQEIDESLNAEGVKQVREAAKLLPGDIDLIISSPLRRTTHTAQIINEVLNKQIELNDDIKELSCGSLAGKSWSEVVEETGDKDAEQKDTEIRFDYRDYGGESAEMLKQRVAKFVEETKLRHPDKKILVSTHGGVIDTMYLLFPRPKAADDNASIHEFDF